MPALALKRKLLAAQAGEGLFFGRNWILPTAAPDFK